MSAEQPFVGVQAVVVLREDLDRLVDGVGVLDGLANARGQRPWPLMSKRVWPMVVSADEQAGVVEVIIHAALDAAGIGLHQDAMALGRLDVEPDVVEVATG